MTRRAWFAASISVSSAIAIFAACTGEDLLPVLAPDGSPPVAVDSGNSNADASGSSSGAVDASDASEPTLCERAATGSFERLATNHFYASHIATAATKDGWVMGGNVQANQGIPFSYDYDAGILVDAGDKTQFATVVRFGSAGEVVWQKAFGGNSSEQVSSVTVDDADDVYIAGWSWSNSLPIGAKTVSQAGAKMGFVAKLSGMTGDTIWATSFADGQYWYGYGCGGLDYHSGHLVVACSMGTSQSYVAKGGATKSLSNPNPNGSSVYSLDPATGEALWGRPFGSGTDANYSWVQSVDVTASYVVLGGIFDGPKLTSNGVDVALDNPGPARAGFVVELALADGSLHFGKPFGGPTATDIVDIASAAGASDSGGVYVAAGFHGTVSLGGASSTAQSHGKSDMLFAWLNNKQGAPEWLKVMGGPEDDSAYRIRIDSCGRPTVLASINSVLDKVDDASVPAPQNGPSHAILKLDSAGHLLWGKGVSPPAGDDNNGVNVWGFGVHPKTAETRVVGDFWGKIDFGNGENTTATPSKNPFSFDLAP